MIPKIIHYCWFGRNPLPEFAKEYIATWRKFLPDYEIREWNEDNFDVNIIPYTSEAYKAKKYAFVSDYARFWILYHYGGIYFDTDVEVIRNMDDIIERGPFMGIENLATEDKYETVAAGLGLGAEKGMPLYKKILDNYANYHFILDDGTLNLRTVVQYVTVELIRDGLKRSNDIQQCAGIYIYPKDFFNPKGGGILHITENTRTIHQYSATWVSGHNGVVDITSFKYKIVKKKNDLKHWLKKYTLLYKNRLVISNNFLSECYQQTYSPKVVSPFAGGWISDDDFMHIKDMMQDLKDGKYKFIRMGESKYKDKISYDYPILKLTGCDAEVHYEHKDAEEDVRVQIERSSCRLTNKDNLFVFVTNDESNARKFRSMDEHHHLIVSARMLEFGYHVSSIEATNNLNAECKKLCKHIALYK